MAAAIVAQPVSSPATQVVATKEEAMHHRRAVSGVCVLAVVAALAGCGGSSDTTATFTSGYNAVKGALNQTGQEIAKEIQQAPKQTDAQVASNFRSLAARFKTQVAKLQALKPPASVSADWTKVTNAASKLDSDLSAIAAAAASHSTAAAQQAGASLAADAQALTQSLTPVKQKLGLK
jgi:hypothetical protein